MFTEYVEVWTCLTVFVLNIYRTDLDFVGVHVYFSVFNRNKIKMFLYCSDAFRATHHAMLVVGDSLNGGAKTNTRKEAKEKRKSTFNKTMIHLWFCSIQTVQTEALRKLKPQLNC